MAKKRKDTNLNVKQKLELIKKLEWEYVACVGEE
jgi:hypothetical protein